MDDAAREAIRQLEELKTRIAAVPAARPEAEALVLQIRSTVALIFGSDHAYTKEIAKFRFYYARAYPENRANYLENDRQACTAAIDRMINDIRLNGLLTKAQGSGRTSKTNDANQPKNVIAVTPVWKGRFEVESDLVFLAMPFSEAWSNDVWETVRGIVEDAGMRCLRGDESTGSDVMEDVWEGICKARVVIADLTSKNPNVAYEVGLADVLGKDVILLTQTPKDVPFDFLRKRLIPYTDSISGSNKLKAELLKRLKKYTT
ncbi:MAG: hypothetical protein J0M07_26295 [Anaerolineae bacterium]|nr:hypothetical protein [Chloroflexota bacterium]MBN8638853.1 hypothetical protein [Anaerolineae bacterium]